jgi:hypothetical protein
MAVRAMAALTADDCEEHFCGYCGSMRDDVHRIVFRKTCDVGDIRLLQLEEHGSCNFGVDDASLHVVRDRTRAGVPSRLGERSRDRTPSKSSSRSSRR